MRVEAKILFLRKWLIARECLILSRARHGYTGSHSLQQLHYERRARLGQRRVDLGKMRTGR